MKTVRLDPTLEAQVEQAAALRGVTVSAFIRQALERESSEVLAQRASSRLAAFIGSVCSESPTDSSRVKERYQESVRKKAAEWKGR